MPTKPKTHNPLPPYLQAKLTKQREADRERRRREYEKRPERKADNAFYKTARWIAFRKYLVSKPEFALCAECKMQGIITPTTQIDHIKPRKDFPELAWDEDNLQGLCLSHHRAKTNRGE